MSIPQSILSLINDNNINLFDYRIDKITNDYKKYNISWFDVIKIDQLRTEYDSPQNIINRLFCIKNIVIKLLDNQNINELKWLNVDYIKNNITKIYKLDIPENKFFVRLNNDNYLIYNCGDVYVSKLYYNLDNIS